MDFTKNKFVRYAKTLLLEKRKLMIACAVLSFISLSSFLTFHYRSQSITSLAIATLYQAIGNHHSLNKLPVLQKPKLAINELAGKEDRGVHFEFYSSLPNMKMEVAELSPPPLEKFSQQVSKKAEGFLEKPAREKIFTPQNIEKEFSKHLAEKHYVIQLGVFNHLASAQKLSEKVAETGFKVNIIKNTQNNNYRVQLGPFVSIQERESVEQKLVQKGIPFLLRTQQG